MAYEKLKDENYNNLKGINEKVSEYLTQEAQFLDLRNYSFVRPGALVSRPGTENFASLAISSFLATPRGLVNYVKADGSSAFIFDSGPTLYALGPSAIALSLTPNVTTGYPIDYEIANDYLYFANGYHFGRYGGSYSVFYGVPKQRSYVVGGFVTFNTSVSVDGITKVIPSGDYLFRYSPVKTSSFIKPASGQTLGPGVVGQRTQDDETGVNLEFSVNIGATIVGTGSWIMYGFTIQPGYGVSSILPYKMAPGWSAYYGSDKAFPFFVTLHGGMSLYTIQFADYLSDANEPQHPWFTLIPKYLENYNNMLFMAGFSATPSTVWHSNLAEPDAVDAENFFDVRTSNGDEITNLTVFQNSLIIFKKGSIHELTGSSPDSLSLKDMNLEYGCVNNTAAVTFENKLWFMDERGVCEYNGPNTFVVSHAVEESLNATDKRTCRAFYLKKRGEVWFCCSGKAFVYDITVKAWTIYDNLQILNSVGAEVLKYGATIVDLTYVEAGASYINFTRFGDSLFTDRGQAITLVGRTRFHKRLGDSTTELWRRFYLNNEITGSTLAVTLNIYSNYGSGASHFASTNLSQFQSRVDFGIPAKALSVEWVIRATEQVQINGYTVESRYLRGV